MLCEKVSLNYISSVYRYRSDKIRKTIESPYFRSSITLIKPTKIHHMTASTPHPFTTLLFLCKYISSYIVWAIFSSFSLCLCDGSTLYADMGRFPGKFCQYWCSTLTRARVIFVSLWSVIYRVNSSWKHFHWLPLLVKHYLSEWIPA